MRGRHGHWLDLCVIHSIIAATMVLTACERTEKIPLSGRVTFEYSDTSDSDFVFTLANGSSQPIRFEGQSSLLNGTRPGPGSYSAVCHSAQSSVAVAVGSRVQDGGKPSESIEVPSGYQSRLAIRGDDLQHYAGSTCRVGLQLEDGQRIESGEFIP
jgi:hypothetical protein